MGALLEVILPVFLVLGFGYLAAWRGWFSEAGVDGLMVFTQKFAFPCLLFRAISELDLGQTFNLPLLGAFYIGAFACFGLGILGARLLFARPWEDAVAIGMCCLYSNSLLLGLPITERAYGSDALAANFAIVALHSPLCYGAGIALMETVRARGQGQSPVALARTVLRAMLRNALIIGIVLGFAVNLSGLAMPVPFTDAVDMMIRAALPAALFGLGGVLYQYRPEGDLRTIGFVIAVSLLLHPALTWAMGQATGLTRSELRSAVVTAAMPPGVNAYIFASIYGVAKRVAASSVLIGTAAALLTAWVWLTILP